MRGGWNTEKLSAAIVLYTTSPLSSYEPASAPLPPRFYETRKRRTPRARVSKSALTPMGEAVLARDLGLDAEKADPLPVVDLPWAELNPAWVPDGEPGSYEGRREPQQPLGNDSDLWD